MGWSQCSWASVTHKGTIHLGTNRGCCRRETRGTNPTQRHRSCGMLHLGIAAVQPLSPCSGKWFHPRCCGGTFSTQGNVLVQEALVCSRNSSGNVHHGTRVISRTETLQSHRVWIVSTSRIKQNLCFKKLVAVNLSIRKGCRKKSAQKEGLYKGALIQLTHSEIRLVLPDYQFSEILLLLTVEITGKMDTHTHATAAFQTVLLATILRYHWYF